MKAYFLGAGNFKSGANAGKACFNFQLRGTNAEVAAYRAGNPTGSDVLSVNAETTKNSVEAAKIFGIAVTNGIPVKGIVREDGSIGYTLNFSGDAQPQIVESIEGEEKE